MAVNTPRQSCLPADAAGKGHVVVLDTLGRRPCAGGGIIAEACASDVELVSGNGAGAGSGRRSPSTGVRDDATALHVQATDVARFVRALPQLAAGHGIRLYEVSPADESLESVFSYLVAR